MFDDILFFESQKVRTRMLIEFAAVDDETDFQALKNLEFHDIRG